MAKLQGKLPRGNRNGLDGIAERALISEPSTARLIVALVDCVRITRDTDTGDEEATARIHRIEMILERADADLVADILERRYRRRTGVAELPGMHVIAAGGGAGITDPRDDTDEDIDFDGGDR